LDSYINKRNKYFWVIEGDIKGAFGNIHHDILLKLVAKRVADQRLLKLIERLLKAELMQSSLFQTTDIARTKIAICSPLLANIYLDKLDMYWWNTAVTAVMRYNIISLL
jgi:retron-type reverse transcriptase